MLVLALSTTPLLLLADASHDEPSLAYNILGAGRLEELLLPRSQSPVHNLFVAEEFVSPSAHVAHVMFPKLDAFSPGLNYIVFAIAFAETNFVSDYLAAHKNEMLSLASVAGPLAAAWLAGFPAFSIAIGAASSLGPLLQYKDYAPLLFEAAGAFVWTGWQWHEAIRQYENILTTSHALPGGITLPPILDLLFKTFAKHAGFDDYQISCMLLAGAASLLISNQFVLALLADLKRKLATCMPTDQVLGSQRHIAGSLALIFNIRLVITRPGALLAITNEAITPPFYNARYASPPAVDMINPKLDTPEALIKNVRALASHAALNQSEVTIQSGSFPAHLLAVQAVQKAFDKKPAAAAAAAQAAAPVELPAVPPVAAGDKRKLPVVPQAQARKQAQNAQQAQQVQAQQMQQMQVFMHALAGGGGAAGAAMQMAAAQPNPPLLMLLPPAPVPIPLPAAPFAPRAAGAAGAAGAGGAPRPPALQLMTDAEAQEHLRTVPFQALLANVTSGYGPAAALSYVAQMRFLIRRQKFDSALLQTPAAGMAPFKAVPLYRLFPHMRVIKGRCGVCGLGTHDFGASCAWCVGLAAAPQDLPNVGFSLRGAAPVPA